jgi:hypothetical protein
LLAILIDLQKNDGYAQKVKEKLQRTKGDPRWTIDIYGLLRY